MTAKRRLFNIQVWFSHKLTDILKFFGSRPTRPFYHQKYLKLNSDFKMMCNQKLCKRISNITSSGNCNICENAIEEAIKKVDKSRKNKRFEKVDVDFNLMMETQKKLEKGAKVDPGTINVLVLSGIINILCQRRKS
jgi:copper chaperone CopZ